MVFKKVVDYYTDSTNAGLSSQDLLATIMNTRMATDMKGDTYEKFLIKYQESLRRYDRQVPPSEQLSSAMKKSLLITLVQGVPALSNVKHTADIMKTATGNELSYSQFADLLMSAAQLHDNQFKNQGNKADKRRVYTHELDFLDYNQYEEDSTDAIDTYEIYSTRGRPTGYFPKLNRDQWNQLSSEDRTVWDSLSDAGKSTITSKKPPPTTQPRNVNLSDMSVGDFISAFVHQSNDLRDDETPVSDSKTSHLNQSKSSPAKNHPHPAGLQRLLSSKEGVSSSPEKSSSDQEKKAHFGQLSANLTDVYTISKHDLNDSKLSLIDRGANGGVAGEDMRLIFTVPERFVDIQGIDNHQLSKIPIATVGGVVETQEARELLSSTSTLTQVKAPAFILQLNWNTTVKSLMTDHLWLVENNALSRLTAMFFHYESREGSVDWRSGHLLMQNLIPYRI